MVFDCAQLGKGEHVRVRGDTEHQGARAATEFAGACRDNAGVTMLVDDHAVQSVTYGISISTALALTLAPL